MRLIGVDGHAGSGKSTFAGRLAAALGGAPVLHLDDIASHDALFDWTGRLLTQVIEYHRLGFNTGDSSFAATFFGLTGLHGAHVFVGLTILLVMTIRAFRGHFTPEAHRGVEVPGIYWHFVDVMWIIVYSTVYLL